jgi:hypothetical protein
MNDPIQETLFGDEAHARTSHPVTSHEAARSVTRLPDRQRAVLRVLKLFGPLHNDGLIEQYRKEKERMMLPVQTDQSIRSRRSELTDLGLVIDTGHKAILESGRRAIVWRTV